MEQEKKPVVDSLQPTGFRVLLKIYKKPTEVGGFITPESENSGMPALGEIKLLGKKTWVQHLQMWLGLKPRYKLGQWVYFRKYSVDTLSITSELGDLTLYVLEENEIIGLVSTI